MKAVLSLSLSVVALLVAIGMSITFPANARAETLQEAVTAYNAVADDLPALWSAYEDSHEAALEDHSAAWNYYYLYLTESDVQDAFTYYALYEDALEDFVVSSGPALEDDLASLYGAMDTSLSMLQHILVLDALDSNYVAYESGSPWFDTPEDPFPFWNDPNYPEYTGWRQIVFPHLYTGPQVEYTAYSGSSLVADSNWISDFLDWLGLGEWFYEHGDDIAEHRGSRASDFDLLCDVCLNRVNAAQARSELLNRGYTDEEIAFFCDQYGPNGLDWCSDDNLREWEKAKAVYDAVPRTRLEDQVDAAEAGMEGIQSAYWSGYEIIIST